MLQISSKTTKLIFNISKCICFFYSNFVSGIFIYTQKFNQLTNNLASHNHPQLHNLRSFSSGNKFKSKHKTLLLFDFFMIGTACTTRSLLITNPSLMAALCLLICPPSACPIENSSPHMEHPCVFGFTGELGML